MHSMPNIEQAILSHLPQTAGPGELSPLENKAYELALLYPRQRGILPQFLTANNLTEPELIATIKWAANQGDHTLIAVAAHWLALADSSKVALKMRLEKDFPDPAWWKP
jgi:hypothetical protein